MALLLSSCGGHGDGDGNPIAMERDAAACTDFYAHANSHWIAATPIPTDASSINIFTGVAARNQKALLAELDRLANGNGVATTPDQQALADLHASRADAVAIERAGLAPLAEDLALIDRMANVSQLPLTWGRLMRHGVRLPVSLKFEAFDNPELLLLHIHNDRLKVGVEPKAPFQVAMGGTSADEADAARRFEAHIARTLTLTGLSAAEAMDIGPRVAAIERSLASDTAAGAQVDPDATAPRFAMSDLLAATGMPGALPYQVDDATLHILGRLQAAHDVPAWRGFMRWRLARSFTDHLPAPFATERARWDVPESNDVSEDKEPVDARLAFLARTLPRQLDLFFTQRILPKDTGTHMRDIADGIRAALHRHLDDRDWLNATSRAASHRLLDTVELVYPALDEVHGAETATPPAVPTMRRDALLDNVRRAAAYDLDRRFGLALTSRTGRNFDGDAWSNFEARYNSIGHHVIVGPATIQALLAEADGRAKRHGVLGVMMAHELLHMFEAPTDRRFFAGLPADVGWLDAADQPYFNGMVARLQQDYASWTLAHHGLAAPKVRFMGEDLSDLGSVPVALSALRHAGSQGAADEDVFYRAFASTTRARQSLAQDRAFIVDSSAHAFYSYRINGPLSNLPSFAHRYGCVAGDAMVRSPETRVHLW